MNELLRVGKDTDVRNSVNVNILGSLHKKCNMLCELLGINNYIYRDLNTKPNRHHCYLQHKRHIARPYNIWHSRKVIHKICYVSVSFSLTGVLDAQHSETSMAATLEGGL